MRSLLIVLLAIPAMAFAETAPTTTTTAATPAAETGAHKEETFAKHKKEMMATMESNITQMQAMKTCVAATKKQDDLKKCHEMHEKMAHDFMEHMKNMKKEDLEKHIKALQAQKDKMGSTEEKKDK